MRLYLISFSSKAKSIINKDKKCYCFPKNNAEIINITGMEESYYTTESPSHSAYDNWDSKLDIDLLEPLPGKSFNDSSLILDNGTLYGSSKGLGKRRVISSLEDSDPVAKEDHRELISRINEMLKRNGFQSIRSSSHGSFLQLIQNLVGKIEEITFGMNFSGVDEVFKRSFSRNIDKSSKYDMTVVNLISLYELQKRGYEKEIEKISKDLQVKRKMMGQIEENLRQGYHKALNEMQEKLNMLETRCSDLKPEKKTESFENSGESQRIIDEVCRILSIKHPNQIVPAVVKLEKVLRAVPQLEKFIKEVYQLVSADERTGKLSMEQVIPTLKQSFKELKELRGRRRTPDISINTSFHQEVLEHFKHLFEIEKDEDIIETMDQVFLFVHELRSFLKSIRIALNLDEEVTVNGILVRLKHIIENY